MPWTFKVKSLWGLVSIYKPPESCHCIVRGPSLPQLFLFIGRGGGALYTSGGFRKFQVATNTDLWKRHLPMWRNYNTKLPLPPQQKPDIDEYINKILNFHHITKTPPPGKRGLLRCVISPKRLLQKRKIVLKLLQPRNFQVTEPGKHPQWKTLSL